MRARNVAVAAQLQVNANLAWLQQVDGCGARHVHQLQEVGHPHCAGYSGLHCAVDAVPWNTEQVGQSVGGWLQPLRLRL